MFMVFATSLVVFLHVFLCYCRYFDETLQQCFLFFIVVVIPGQLSGERL